MQGETHYETLLYGFSLFNVPARCNLFYLHHRVLR